MTPRFARNLPLLLSTAVAFGASFGARVASAEDAPQSDNVLKAQALFAEGRKLVQSGNYQQACGKFEQSLRFNVGIGTQFNLADCWEHVGRIASARAVFLGAAATAHAAGQNEREQVAKARADGLEPRLLRLVIDVRATDPKLVIRRNQVLVEHDAWNSATPVDPGVYLIEATAPGKRAWSARVTVPFNATEAVSVTVPPLESSAAACAPKGAEVVALPSEPAPIVPETEPGSDAPKPSQLAADADKPAPLTDDPPPPRSARRTAYALSLGGFGVASLVVGAALAAEYKAKNDDAKLICPSSAGCSAYQIKAHGDFVSDAKAFRAGSFVGFGVGAAALVGAAVVYFAPSSPAQRYGFVAAPFVASDGSWGAAASGRF
jgi:hypothetical protein